MQAIYIHLTNERRASELDVSCKWRRTNERTKPITRSLATAKWASLHSHCNARLGGLRRYASGPQAATYSRLSSRRRSGFVRRRGCREISTQLDEKRCADHEILVSDIPVNRRATDLKIVTSRSYLLYCSLCSPATPQMTFRMQRTRTTELIKHILWLVIII